jgi:dTDP-glucose pyrophosphorylase
MKIVVPMAGAGSRFEKAGYTFPKPLIEVQGQPMIAKVVENLNLQGQYIFLVQKAHYEKYDLKGLLNMIAPGCEIVQIDGLTEGAACTVLKAKQFIDNNEPLIIANSDQWIKWNSFETISSFNHKDSDGGILTFKSVHPKHSFAKVDGNGWVSEVAEKNPISNDATVGIYHWKKGSDFVKYAEQMIAKDIRTNNEFYVCPVFNEAIKDGKKIKASLVDQMWGMGTPEELNNFLTHHKD